MTVQSISEVVQQAVEWTGREQVTIEDRTRLLSDRGSVPWHGPLRTTCGRRPSGIFTAYAITPM